MASGDYYLAAKHFNTPNLFNVIGLPPHAPDRNFRWRSLYVGNRIQLVPTLNEAHYDRVIARIFRKPQTRNKYLKYLQEQGISPELTTDNFMVRFIYFILQIHFIIYGSHSNIIQLIASILMK